LVKKANPAVTEIACFLTYADPFVGAAVSSKFCIVVITCKAYRWHGTLASGNQHTPAREWCGDFFEVKWCGDLTMFS